MSNYKGHLVGGAVTFTGLYFGLTALRGALPSGWIELLGITLFASLFPDIDTKSKIQMSTYRVLFVLFIVLFWFGYYQVMALGAIMLLVPLVVHHRGLTHQRWFLIALPLAVAAIVYHYAPAQGARALCDALFFIAGAFSHLVLDVGIKRVIRLR